MICPFTRITGNTAGISCKDSCAWWDKEVMQCQEVTKTQMLVAVTELLATLTSTLVLIQKGLEYGTGKAVE